MALAASLGVAKPAPDTTKVAAPVTGTASAAAAESPWDTFTGAVNGFVSGVKKFVGDTVVTISNTVRVTSVVALGAVVPRLSVVPGLPQLVDALAQQGPSTATSRLYRTLRYLTATDADGIVINTVLGRDNTQRLVVYLGGTVPFSTTNQPVVDNLIGWNKSVKPAQLNLVLTALHGDKTKPVLLVGYSQGGMDAQNLAQSLAGMGYNVQGVVGFGSPIVRTPGATYETVFLADILDPVSTLRQGDVSVAGRQLFTGISSSALDPGFGNLNVHARITTYEQIGRQFDSAAGYSDIKRIIRQFQDPNAVATPAFTEWLGTWSANGVTLPAYVVLLKTDPVYGMISVGGGQCVATWSEAGRVSDTERYVNADVTQGSCVDNQWHVTMSGSRISGSDSSGANASFSVRRR